MDHTTNNNAQQKSASENGNVVVDARKRFMARRRGAPGEEQRRQLLRTTAEQEATRGRAPEATSEEKLEGFEAFIDGWLAPRVPATPLAQYRQNGGRPVWIIDGEIYDEISSEEFLRIIDAHGDEDSPPNPEHPG